MKTQVIHQRGWSSIHIGYYQVRLYSKKNHRTLIHTEAKAKSRACELGEGDLTRAVSIPGTQQ